MIGQTVHRLLAAELEQLRHLRLRRRSPPAVTDDQRSMGEHVSDSVAALVGSWRFIIVQSIILMIWIALNLFGYVEHWDPYPFILLNLVLSFQAAYTAPIIMMSQNRQSTLDRNAAQHDYEINLKAELEIELLHEKLDLLRETEIARLIELVRMLEAKLQPTSPECAP